MADEPESLDDFFRRVQKGEIPGIISSSPLPSIQLPTQGNEAGLSDNEFRKLIAASPDKPLAPILAQIKPYVEGSQILTPMQQGAVAKQCQQIILERGLLQGHVPTHDTVREHLRQFAAGLQFAYELEPWPESSAKPVNFEISNSPSLRMGAYLGIPLERNRLVLGVTPFGLANHGVMKHYNQSWEEQFEEGRKLFHAAADSFRTGMEEGRHIAQELIPALREQTGLMPPAAIAQSSAHEEDLGEIEAKVFMGKHYDALIERSERISALSLPPLRVSQRR